MNTVIVKMFLICHVSSCEHMFKELCELMGGSEVEVGEVGGSALWWWEYNGFILSRDFTRPRHYSVMWHSV